jgi:putative transposase
VLSLLYRLVRCLFGLLAVLVRSDLSKDVELLVLRHENQVLRRRLRGRRRWADIFRVTPATILRWHRHLVALKWTYTDRRQQGRPSTGVSIKALIVRMARDNLTWGHRRIQTGDSSMSVADA